MTTEINKYHTSKIYKISSNQCEKFYIGSTTTTLKERLRHHKKDYTSYIKGNRGNVTSFEIVKFDDAIIELIKDVKCESRKELERIEGECILEHHNRILNKVVAGRTKREYYEANKEKRKKYYEEYNEINKDKRIEKAKEYYEANKDKMKQYREVNKDKNKEWREENKDKLKEWREAYKEKAQEKFNCNCGGRYTFHDKIKHAKTQKHQLFISNQQP